MNWLLIAIIAHFLFAIVFVIDKYLFSHTQLRPAAYAFYVGILGGLTILLFPLGFSLLPTEQLIISLIAGILFVFAIFFFYKSVQMGEVSRITPVIGGLVPIFTLALSYILLERYLNFNQLIAFGFLILGGVIMSWPIKKTRLALGDVKTPLIKRLPLAILAALFFAGSYVLTKLIYIEQPFINGFIWIRLGGVLGAIILFAWPSTRKKIFETSDKIKFKTGRLAVFNKSLSALSFVLLNYAIFLGSVALVNALQGIQYIFLLLFALFLSKKFPEIIKEQISQSAILQKVFAILFVILGLGILAF
ncbi:DMT family transporter [Patescibacteria group bacterium]|nr:DMT family transporter [Patescibacteria group bacterium]MBU1563632.1 DMT family transporter [Patescibacteria group bacterium]MBU2068032.1 DMT family transporter [Patescibacteria group bacterium]